LFETLSKDRLYKGIVDQIIHSILSGKIRTGDQLPPEPELAQQFGVSRTVVREAIKALSLVGLVDVSPGRGTFVTQPPIETIASSLQLMFKLENHSFDDLLFARHILEVPIARLAAENAKPENAKALEANLRGMEGSLNNPEAFIKYDTSFHAELARATQNAVLGILVQPVMMMLLATRQALVRVPDMAERALAFHKRIYQAVLNKDSDTAEKSMRDHLTQVAEDLDRARKHGILNVEDLYAKV
jgi:DNA-binding FadR family transcriptional regulator